MEKKAVAFILILILVLGTIMPVAGSESPEVNFTAGEMVMEQDHALYAEELQSISEDAAGASTEYNPEGTGEFFAIPTDIQQKWSFDVYYVNQEHPKKLSKAEDFNLKYQMEFHTNKDLNPGTVLIRIPARLLWDRYGKEILPAEIGVPLGTQDVFTEISNSPFNYYMEGEHLVFFNYRKIYSGTNAAVQVLYKNLMVLDIVDQTQWKIIPEISVTDGTELQCAQPEPLTGVVDTGVSLNAVSKEAYRNADLDYTPELYTPEQLLEYVKEVPEKFISGFADYAYVVWKMKVTGSVTQAWDLYLKENARYTCEGHSGLCEIAGINIRILDSNHVLCKERQATSIADGIYAGGYKIGEYMQDFKGRKDLRLECVVVTAYPKQYAIDNKTVLTNDAEFILQPLDGVDEQITACTSANWTWADYQWAYKGDTIGVHKKSPQPEYPGWMNLYRKTSNGGGLVQDLPFQLKSSCRGYGYTHHISGPSLGQYKKDSYCEITTCDDAVYAYPLTGTNAGQKILLSDKDYYFSDVTISQKDVGYDVFSDHTAEPESLENILEIDRGIKVYAMFRDCTQWEMVEHIPWNSTGTAVYTFSELALKRQPWRIKAVHNTVDYKTECEIDLKIRIRQDSVALKNVFGENQEDAVMRLENIGAVTGRAFSPENPSGVYFHDESVTGNLYQEEGLIGLTQELYGVIAMRDNSIVTLSSLRKHAFAGKYAKASNNPMQERIELQYTVSAREGYELYSEQILPLLKLTELPFPQRAQAVFYDLLPFGVRFDPSKEIKAGRLLGISEANGKIPALWECGQVRVTVDSETDIIQNYRGTGRTMIRFHVSYEGTDPSFYDQGFWSCGFGISFSAYCDWKDIPAAQKTPNICAYMPEPYDVMPVLGAKDEVACDDGMLIPSVHSQDYQYFGADINEDGVTNIPNVLYCRAMAFEDLAVASQSGIEKYVRADENRFGIFGKKAVVAPGKGYTYEISVTNIGQQMMKGIVVFDRLEHAAAERRAEEPEMDFDTVWWTGVLSEVDLALLQELRISPVVYYHTDRANAPVPSEAVSAQEVLTEENGWYRADVWKQGLNEVRAVAIDLSHKTDGTEFKLGNMETISFQLKMKAPEDSNGAVSAYNHASFYSVSEGNVPSENITQMSEGNSVKVQIELCNTLEVIKEVNGETPECAKEEAFLFFVSSENPSGDSVPYASREYSCYKRKGQEWVQKPGIYATDSLGRFRIKANEKAVFKEKAGISFLRVREAENPFWKQEMREEHVEKLCRLYFKNTFRPVLFLEKKISGVPKDLDVSAESFQFQIHCNGVPASNVEYWNVSDKGVYGVFPKKLGEGKTDANGVLSIRSGEILAVFPGKITDEYTVSECKSAGNKISSWIAVKDFEKGILSAEGNFAVLENAYKWKDLYLTKKLTRYPEKECQEEFSFQIWEEGAQGETKELIVGKDWELLDSKMKPVEPPVSGVIGKDGILKCACAGKVVRIRGLEADKTYVIKEQNCPTDYIPLNEGIERVTMPIYSESAKGTVINEYLLRSLKISKLIIPDYRLEGNGSGGTVRNSETIGKSFQLKVLVKKGIEFVPLQNVGFAVEKNGVRVRTDLTDAEGNFQISNMETAVFEAIGKTGMEYRIYEVPDLEYPPIYPAQGGFAEGLLADEGSEVTIINGSGNHLVFRKKYVAASGDALIKEALKKTEFLRSDFLKAGFVIEADFGGGWGVPSMDVLCIDTVSGETRVTHTEAKMPLLLYGTELAVVHNRNLGMRFRITEQPEYQNRVVKDVLYTNCYLMIEQLDPANGEGVIGIAGKERQVSITNEAEAFFIGKNVHKKMLKGSSEVPVASELVFRVEEFNGSYWMPAKGVRYVIVNPGEDFSGNIKKTASDGLIRLYQTSVGTPSVQFEKNVLLGEVQHPFAGNVRVVEVPELSDSVFGHLIGYSSSKMHNSMNDIPVYELSQEDRDTFVNSNVGKLVEIEKKADSFQNQNFTMRISPKDTAGNGYGQSASNLPYVVYDSATGVKIQEGKTREDGCFSIKSGEYVRFHLPEGSSWTVAEVMPYPYELDRVEGIGENITIRADKGADIELLQVNRGVLTQEMVTFGVYDKNSGEKINLTQGDVIVPNQVMFRGQVIYLTGIGANAFEGRGDISSIYISDNLRTVEASAFRRCTGLKTVRLPRYLSKIDSYAFEACSSLTECTIPRYTATVGKGIFRFCHKLVSVQLPPRLKKISVGMFEECESLTECVLPGSVTVIEPQAFLKCTSLKRILIPSSVTAVGEFSFYGCSNLEQIHIPESVTILGRSVFQQCNRLSVAHLSSRIRRFESYSFEGCTSLETIIVPSGVTAIETGVFKNCMKLREITMPLNLTSLGTAVFSECISLKNIALKGTFSSVPDYLFQNCRNLEKVIMPETVQRISYCAFYNCSGLKVIQLPNSLRYMDGKCFYGCRFREITIPSSTERISEDAFMNCMNLQCIRIGRITNSVANSKWGAPSSCQVIWSDSGVTAPVVAYEEEDEFFYYTAVNVQGDLEVCMPKDQGLQFANIPENVRGRRVTQIGKRAFADCKNLMEITIPSSIHTVEEYAFAGCERLAAVAFPDSVKMAGTNIFEDCTSLTNVRFSNQIKRIPAHMFRNCKSLKSMIIPPEITVIDSYAFAECVGLEELTIPVTVSEIGSGAFQNCTGLKRVTGASGLRVLEKNLFYGCVSLVDAALTGNIGYIAESAFENCYSLANIGLWEGLETLRSNCFRNCRSLKRVILPSGVTQIPDGAFAGCYRLEEMHLSSLTSGIGIGSFQECRSLKTIYLPSTISVIKSYAFQNCIMLREIQIPENVIWIEEYTFQGCSSLQTIFLGSNTVSIKNMAFSKCSNLKEIVIPSHMKEIAPDAFEFCESLERMTILKPENTLSGVPWKAPNKALIVEWSGI